MPLIDFEKWTAQAMDRIVLQFNIDNDPIFSPRFRRGIKFFGYQIIPFILSIVTVIIMFTVFFRVYASIGFEKTAVTLLILLLWSQGSKV